LTQSGAGFSVRGRGSPRGHRAPDRARRAARAGVAATASALQCRQRHRRECSARRGRFPRARGGARRASGRPDSQLMLMRKKGEQQCFASFS
jgi:hypothetical protein